MNANIREQTLENDEEVDKRIYAALMKLLADAAQERIFMYVSWSKSLNS